MSAPLSVGERSAAPGRSPRQRLAVAGLAVLLVLAVLSAWLLWDNRRLTVARYEVAVTSADAAADGVAAAADEGTGVGASPAADGGGLPAGGLRIAQVSDLHAADFGDFQDRLLTAVEDAHPDLIALTGDVIDRRTGDLTAVLELAASLTALAPTYMVLGNHDADSDLRGELLAGLEGVGVVILRDEATTLTVGGTRITLAGLDDPRVAWDAGRTPTPPRQILDRLDLPKDGTTVLLAHRPELLEEYAGEDVDLVLSGHAHGGQVRLPLIGPLFAPHQGFLPALAEGVHTSGTTTMVISRGLGNSIAGVRVNDPRELVIIDLVG